MTTQKVGQKERATQDRIVTLFRSQLNYEYLGNWEAREGNSNIEEDILKKWLNKRGYNNILITKAVDKLRAVANNHQESLYTNNKNVYALLRYGVEVKENVEKKHETVAFIDWRDPDNNFFAIAQEVTVRGKREKRPDIVLYVNGIALGVIELKRSTISIGDGIRQSIANQQKEFIELFFTTIQWVFAGNDSEGLRYGTVGTSEKYFLRWKEDENDDSVLQLDKYLLKLCNKERFLEIIYDFVLFDDGVKKLPRVHQYFGIKAAQKHVERREGGIIWHTQGSGKSLVMVWLAKWILEKYPQARIAIITDRTELDKQIKKIFEEAGEEIHRTTNGKDLMKKLYEATPRLLCSLIHKFGNREKQNFEAFIAKIKSSPNSVVGELFVFVDECHRTQSNRLHQIMKAVLRDAVFIGFTGTPLLKKDKKSSLEVFGKYIHTYKYNEAVKDEVVLDLVYEARDVDQRLSSPEKIDLWFDAKTRGLNDFQKSKLKKKWGTMQKVLSSRSRLEKIVGDIILDFSTKPRLNQSSGNAILVAGSIYEATRYYELFQNTPLKGKCALITSYTPNTQDISKENTGDNTETQKEYIHKMYTKLLKKSTTEKYEDNAKKEFIKKPMNMMLVIVVDKLLTGFDAPACTYLYIDKKMKDHGLFQAICRVNRLDSEDKQFGYIVDYKDLFKKVENAITVYTSELDYDKFQKKDIDIVLKDRLTKGKERLDETMNTIDLICESVAPPKDSLAYIRYFCGNTENEDDLQNTAEKRTLLYKHTITFVRAYANIANELSEAGYSSKQIANIKTKVDFYLNLREEIRLASGETLDLKTYEADMRHLIDTYIQAKDSRRIDPFGDLSLLDIITTHNIIAAIDTLPDGIKSNQTAVAETIENNVRTTIIKQYLTDPAYFEEMSKLLAEIIKRRKENADSYEEYLRKIVTLAHKVNKTQQDDNLPKNIETKTQQVLYRNLGNNEELAISVDEAVQKNRMADWRGNITKERKIKAGLYSVLQDGDEVERIFEIIREQDEY